MAVIPFGEYIPDSPAFLNQGLTVCKNVLPGGNSYFPFLDPVVYSTDALDSRCQGGASFRDKTGNGYTFVGDAAKLYELNGTTVTDVSKGGGYATAVEEAWEFAQWSNKVVATNYNDDLQVIEMGAANFADLAGTPPKARHMAVIRNFLVLGNINDAVDGAVPNRVQWCGFEDITTWGVDPSAQSDYEDLEEKGGSVQKVVGGDRGVIFREKSIHLMDYVGSPAIFQFTSVEENRGTPAPNSVIKLGNVVAYLGQDGFYVFDGNKSVPIGTNKIDQFFFDDVDSSNLHRVYASLDFDKNRQIVYWAYPSVNSDGTPDKILAYNYSPNSTKRWSLVEGLSIQLLLNTISEQYTLDGLDAVNTNLDLLGFSLDSRVWISNNTLLSGFNSDNEIVNFTGNAADAVIETPEFQIFDGNRANLTKVRPLYEGSASVSVEVGYRDKLSDDVTWTSSYTQNSSGDIPVKNNARYHRLRFKTSGHFDHLQGYEIVSANKEGVR